MDNGANATGPKPATAARIHDYFLGGLYNFPADREAARKVIAQFPFVPAAARASRAFAGRAVRYMVAAGVRQFLTLDSGLPTAGNVHEVAQEIAPEARVVYADTDPVVVAESLEILDGNDRTLSIRADMRAPKAVLAHSQVRKLLDFGQPLGVLFAGLQFVPDDADAYRLVTTVTDALAPGSYLALTQTAVETFESQDRARKLAGDVYSSQTAAWAKLRTREGVARFFIAGVEMVEPGVVWAPEWRPEPGDPTELAGVPEHSASWVAVGRLNGTAR